MSEDIEMNKHDIEEVEKEVLSKQKQKEVRLRQEIETKIKQQMETERLHKEKESAYIQHD